MQATRPLLMIPGPIEFSDDVFHAVAQPAYAHTAPEFIQLFGESLEMLREVSNPPPNQLNWSEMWRNIQKKLICVLFYIGGMVGCKFFEGVLDKDCSALRCGRLWHTWLGHGMV